MYFLILILSKMKILKSYYYFLILIFSKMKIIKSYYYFKVFSHFDLFKDENYKKVFTIFSF